jgi:glycosyltransferase involved in cell wall biosynthesis
MDLIVNGPAVALSSLGVRRYFSAIMRHLSWPGRVEVLPLGPWRMLERPRELLRRGRSNAIFWTPCQRGPLNARRHVVTVHDCINVEYVYRDDWRRAAYVRLFNRVLNASASIVAISCATRAAILRNYRVDPAKITVIRSAEEGLSVGGAALAESPRKERPYVLMVTNSLAHKNTAAACEAFVGTRAVASGVLLRVIGSLSQQAEAICRSTGIRYEIRSHVDDAQLREWYRHCLFLLSPSLAEGHNLPIAEALAEGANVLCSDIDVHREFYDGRVEFFDPRDSGNIRSAIDAALERPGRWFTEGTRAERRSFADVARDYRNLFQSLR